MRKHEINKNETFEDKIYFEKYKQLLIEKLKNDNIISIYIEQETKELPYSSEFKEYELTGKKTITIIVDNGGK